jgi:ribonuclease R
VELDVEATKDPQKLAETVKAWSLHPLSNVLNMLLLRSMKQAYYDVRNLGHFGLASKAYLHFTSPIRRYPDLVVHRIVHKALLGETIDRSEKAQSDLGDAAIAASTAERRSMEVEREISDLYRASLMKERVGERYEGTVTGLVGSGVFVQLDAPFVDVLVKLEDLGTSGGYELDDEGLKVVGQSGEAIMLGDRMTIEIVDVAILRRTVYGRRIGVRRGRDDGERRREPKKFGRRDKHGHKAKGAKGFRKGKKGRR